MHRQIEAKVKVRAFDRTIVSGAMDRIDGNISRSRVTDRRSSMIARCSRNRENIFIFHDGSVLYNFQLTISNVTRAIKAKLEIVILDVLRVR